MDIGVLGNVSRFTYDPVNRLMQAKFEQHNPDDHNWNKDKVDFSVMMGDGDDTETAYDANGNIKRMQQWGLKITGIDKIDDLTFNYMTNGNKLYNVIDDEDDPATKLGDFRTPALHQGSQDYYYDGSGNMIRDLNKDIGKSNSNGISYNHMNLCRTVSVYTTNGAAKGTIIRFDPCLHAGLCEQAMGHPIAIGWALAERCAADD